MVDARKTKPKKQKQKINISVETFIFVTLKGREIENVILSKIRMTKKLADLSIRMSCETSVRWFFDWSQWRPAESEFLRAVSCIQLDEKERLGRFVFRKDARASLIGRLMMRKFINEYCQIPYDKIIFQRDVNNKPILSKTINSKFANFNVSHQGKFTVLAGDLRSVKLGVDVMKLEYSGGKELREFFRIMGRNFSPHEWSEIRGNPEQSEIDQTAMFCRHWALKESYVKATGIGIVVDLEKLDFHTKQKLSLNEYATDTSLWIDGVEQNWLFHETLLDHEHCVAVAIEKGDEITNYPCEKFEKLTFDQIVVNAVPLYPADPLYAKKYFDKAENPSKS